MAKQGTWFLLTLLCIWLGCFLVEGRCSGKWARHSCISGNGKRSGTDTEELAPPNSRTNASPRLADILLGSASRIPFLNRHKINLDDLTGNGNNKIDEADAISSIIGENGGSYDGQLDDEGRESDVLLGDDDGSETFSLQPLKQQQQPSEEDIERMMEGEQIRQQKQQHPSRVHQDKLRALWRKLLIDFRGRHSSRR